MVSPFLPTGSADSTAEPHPGLHAAAAHSGGGEKTAAGRAGWPQDTDQRPRLRH